MKTRNAVIFLAATVVLAAAGQALAQSPVKPLTVDDCVRLVLKQSPDLAKAKSNLTIAGAGLQSSIGAMLPHLSASSGYNRSGLSVPDTQAIASTGNLTASRETASDRYSSGISVSQTLVNLPVWARIGQSAYTRKAAGASYDQARAAIVYNVKQSFYNLVKLQKGLNVAQASVSQSEEQARQARLMNQLGSMSRADLLKIEVQLTQSKVNYLSARNGLVAGQQALATSIGLTGDIVADTLLAIPDTGKTLTAQDSLMRAALSASPAYSSARHSYHSAALGAWSSWTSKLPSLSASYSYGFGSNRQYQDRADWNRHDSWTVGLALNWNIFDGFVTEAGIRQAYAQKHSAEADLFTARQSVASEIEQSYLGLKTAREELSLVVVLLQQAEESYKLTSEKYRLGSASVLDLLTSQVVYNQAQQTATNSICDYYLAEARMKKALGQW